jgi:endonuclease/exonuclease/phosphatase family metal-dependent hydrolase
MPLRVLQLNVWATGGDWQPRRRALQEGLDQLQPDLLALEEVVLANDFDQARDLLGADYELFHARRRSADGIGVTIASRWPIERAIEIDLRSGDRQYEGTVPGALLAHIRVPGAVGDVVFANHNPTWEPSREADRERESVRVARAIDEFAGDIRHRIVAGDLDADAASASIRFWTGRQSIDGMSVCYRDAWEALHASEPGETFTPDNPLVADPDWPFRRIDYVLVRCGDHGGPTLRIERCERTFDRPIDGVWASDHFGVAVDLGAPVDSGHRLPDATGGTTLAG